MNTSNASTEVHQIKTIRWQTLSCYSQWNDTWNYFIIALLLWLTNWMIRYKGEKWGKEWRTRMANVEHLSGIREGIKKLK